MINEDYCYRAVCSRDGRFDGAFFTAVLTTGIYCRPSCPATTPKRENVRFFTTAAAAQEAGFRACKRCRPDAAPGSPEWVGRQDTVARAMRLIGDGIVDREGVGGLARRLGYSPRQLHRIVFAELGTGPLTLAKAHRVQHARMLLETTELPVTDVAGAAGFGSIRQFNDCVRQVFGCSPTELRRAGPVGRAGSRGEGGHAIEVHLSYRPPLQLTELIRYLAVRAVPGVESFDGSTYQRVLGLPHGSGVLSVDVHQQSNGTYSRGGKSRSQTAASSHGVAYLVCRLQLDDHRDFIAAVARARRLFDLDADPVAVARVLEQDASLAPLVQARPGLRVPGSVDAFETAVRAVAGQQVSLAAGLGAVSRMVELFGKPLQVACGGLTRQFPEPETLAAASPSELPLPSRRAHALVAVAGAVSDGSLVLDPGVDRDSAEETMVGMPGIGPWTAGYVRMRGLGDPDVFLGSDLVVQQQLGLLSFEPSPKTWRPWGSYATAHLWAAADRRDHPDVTPAERPRTEKGIRR